MNTTVASRLFGCATLACLGLASAAQAQEVLLYGFETGVEGWRADPVDAPIAATISNTTGVTQGSQALQIITQGGYRQVLGGNFAGDTARTSALASAVQLKVDVTLPEGAAVGTDFIQIRSILNYGGENIGGYFDQSPLNEYSSFIYGTRPVTFTISFDLTQIWNGYDNNTTNGLNPSNGQNLWWTEIGLAINTNGPSNGALPPTTLFIDNVRIVVPEPTTLGALTGASLLLLARRRR